MSLPQSKNHINFTMILFWAWLIELELLWPMIIPRLIGVQTKVREFFGWEYQSDLLSANLMAESLNFRKSAWG